MLFSTLPIIDSSGAVAAHSSDGVSVDHASFLRMLMSPIGLDSRNWKCRRTAIGMLMALLHKLEPSTDEPMFYQQSNTIRNVIFFLFMNIKLVYILWYLIEKI